MFTDVAVELSCMCLEKMRRCKQKTSMIGGGSQKTREGKHLGFQLGPHEIDFLIGYVTFDKLTPAIWFFVKLPMLWSCKEKMSVFGSVRFIVYRVLSTHHECMRNPCSFSAASSLKQF